MPRAGNRRRAYKQPRIVTVKLPDGSRTERATSGRYVFTHAVLAQKGEHREAGLVPLCWYVSSWHESKKRADTIAADIRKQPRIEWIGGRPTHREPRWADVRVVRVKVEEEQPWAAR